MASMDDAVINLLKRLAEECEQAAVDAWEENGQLSYGYFCYSKALLKAAQKLEGGGNENERDSDNQDGV